MGRWWSIPAVAGFVLIAESATAHQDAIFLLRPDGSIDNLPAGYGPGVLVITDSMVKLSLAGHENHLSDCLLPIFRLPAGESIELHGSAHHDLDRFPPYLVMGLPQDSMRFAWFNGYELFFHLETAQLLEINRMELTPGPDGGSVGSTLRRVPAFSELCGGPEPRLIAKPEPCGWFRRLTRRCS